MKTLRTILATIAILFGAMTMNAQRMSYDAMCNNARFLTDRMAYELGIRSMSLIDDLYRINYDYIYGVNDYLDEVAYGYHYDDYMEICAQRDYALRRLLGDLMWDRLVRYNYFYRPIVFANRGWHFSIYDYDRHGFNHYFFGVPHHYHVYTGGHYFRGMAPRGGHIDMRPGMRPEPRRNGAVGMHNNGGMHNNNGMHNGAGVHNNGGMRQHDSNGGMRQHDNMGGQHNNDNMGNRRPEGNSNMQPQGGARPQENMGGQRPQMDNSRSSSNNRSSSRMGTSSRGTTGETRSMSTPSRSNMGSSSRGSMGGGSTRSSMGSASRSGNSGGATRSGNSGGSHGGRR